MTSSFKASHARCLAPLPLLLATSCALTQLEPPRKNAPIDGGNTDPSHEDSVDTSVSDGNGTSSPRSESTDGKVSSESRPDVAETTLSSTSGSSDSSTSSDSSPSSDSNLSSETSVTTDFASSENGGSSESHPTSDLTDAAPSSFGASTSSAPGSSSEPTSSNPDPTSDEPPAELPCGPLTADDAVALYVSPNGTDSATCGGASAPCSTITRGISRAAAESKTKLFIQRGSYAEHVNLNSPISLVGGWTVSEGVWSRECTTLADQTELLSTTAVGLRAEFTGSARLQSLTIATQGRNATASESRYGVFATGASTHLELVDVTVRALSANHGSSGAVGTNGAVGANGPAGATPKPAPLCAEGTGSPGAAPATTPDTPQGSFAAAGYAPRHGVKGADGKPGQAGVMGSDKTYTCTFCSLVQNQCQGVAGAPRTASGGLNGCGGAAGTGGLGGTGGGSSVGVFAWFATVQFGEDVAVVAGDGGNGGAGGAGGAGGSGGSGGVGQEVACNDFSCNSSPCNDKFRGDTGGKGGDGSAGAPGGGGAGGWSVGVVNTPGAITGKPLTLVGQAGTSSGSGPAGLAQATYIIP